MNYESLESGLIDVRLARSKDKEGIRCTEMTAIELRRQLSFKKRSAELNRNTIYNSEPNLKKGYIPRVGIQNVGLTLSSIHIKSI
jgi:hypothetical protein